MFLIFYFIFILGGGGQITDSDERRIFYHVKSLVAELSSIRAGVDVEIEQQYTERGPL